MEELGGDDSHDGHGDGAQNHQGSSGGKDRQDGLGVGGGQTAEEIEHQNSDSHAIGVGTVQAVSLKQMGLVTDKAQDQGPDIHGELEA